MLLYYNFLLEYVRKYVSEDDFQLLELGDTFVCTLRPNKSSDLGTIFPESNTCASSKILQLAKIKAISEYVERDAFKRSYAKSTCGFAAYPYILRKKQSILKARRRAYLEMLERYSWKTITAKTIEAINKYF